MKLATAAACAALGVAAMITAQPPALAGGDASRGREHYRRNCLGCHGDAVTAPSIGPPLRGLIGRRAGTVDGTPYGRNLYASGIVWDEASLERYLAAPSEAVHGTIMPIGVHDPGERDDVIAYLRTLK